MSTRGTTERYEDYGPITQRMPARPHRRDSATMISVSGVTRKPRMPHPPGPRPSAPPVELSARREEPTRDGGTPLSFWIAVLLGVTLIASLVPRVKHAVRAATDVLEVSP